MTRKLIQYGLYPSLLLLVIYITYACIHYQWNYQLIYGLTTVFLVFTLLLTEIFFPLKEKWKMTKKSFIRDLKYILFVGPSIAITRAGFGMVAIWYSQHHTGFFSSAPFLISTILFLIVFEFFQYWYHRLSHKGTGRVGKFLWRVHLTHHLPDKLYVVMHAVMHPINAFLSTSIIQLTLILLGVSPEAALAATLLIDLQSLVSHFNVDIRAGFLNYIFIGIETHRYHHSAKLEEAQNYGNTLALWDLIFGTFYYKPGIIPQEIGVTNSKSYPDAQNVIKVIAFPFEVKKGELSH